MKKIYVLTISIVVSIILVIFLALFVRSYIIPIFSIGNSQSDTKETLLYVVQSPDGKYTLEAYRTEAGATVDFSIKVYLISDNNKKLIYDAYHEYEAKIVWLDNSIVSINDKTLDLSHGEKYDWRLG